MNKVITQLRHVMNRTVSAKIYMIEWNIATQKNVGHTITSVMNSFFIESLKFNWKQFRLGRIPIRMCICS